MSSIFRNSIEWQGWGYNALTISFIGTVIFIVLEGWGLRIKNRSIWRNKSGESISVILFIYLGCLFITVSIYGCCIKSIAAIFNGPAGISASADSERFTKATRRWNL